MKLLSTAKQAFTKHFRFGFKPQKRMTVSEWSDENRYLSPKASAEAGRWRTDRTPYLKEIMDELSNMSEVNEVWFMKGAQIGGTECGNNWLGYIADIAPGPTLIVWPTIDVCKKNSKIRLDPLIEECPVLREKIKEKRSRDSDNTTMLKGFPGGFWALTGANSGTGLRSIPCKYTFLDEVDAFPGDVAGEGDPVELVRKRQGTFGSRRKMFGVSTPLDESTSRIEREYLKSDQRIYKVPCPDCDHYQEILWPNIKWDAGKPETAALVCQDCGVFIGEHNKSFMLANGYWEAQNPGARRGKIAGFHLSALYSPLGWYSWADAAEEWDEIQEKKDRERLKVFINTTLGQTWKDESEKPDWEIIYNRRETYKTNTIPEGVVFLTAGVDVQEDRLELEIVGWGRDKVSWSIDYRVLPGKTDETEVWNELEKVINETWEKDTGGLLPLKRVAIDSGYKTQVVYSFVRQFRSTRVIAIKGSDTLSMIFGMPKSVDVRQSGRTIRKGLKLWPLGVSLIKGEVYSFLQQVKKDNEPEPIGYCHFPEYSEEYFLQLTAEELKVKLTKSGHKKREWVKTRERNEALDCRVYARAAAAIEGIDRFTEKHWQQMESISMKEIKSAKKELKQKNKKTKKRRSSGWL